MKQELKFLMTYFLMHDVNTTSSSQIHSQDVMRLQVEYDKYSAERDPAHGLFSGFFGKEWSDKYMKDFLFPLSLEDSNFGFSV